MFDEISRSLLGPWGERLLDIILDHQWIFSGVIVLGAVVVMAIRKAKKRRTDNREERNQK